jgi:hypothetical protein
MISPTSDNALVHPIIEHHFGSNKIIKKPSSVQKAIAGEVEKRKVGILF